MQVLVVFLTSAVPSRGAFNLCARHCLSTQASPLRPPPQCLPQDYKKKTTVSRIFSRCLSSAWPLPKHAGCVSALTLACRPTLRNAVWFDTLPGTNRYKPNQKEKLHPRKTPSWPTQPTQLHPPVASQKKTASVYRAPRRLACPPPFPCFPLPSKKKGSLINPAQLPLLTHPSQFGGGPHTKREIKRFETGGAQLLSFRARA